VTPRAAAFRLSRGAPISPVHIEANGHKLAVVDPSALIQRHACTACGAHLYGPVEKVHAFQGLSFIHPELFAEPGAPAPGFAAFVSSVIEGGVAPTEMDAIRARLAAIGLPFFDCLNPPLMDALATFTARAKGVLS